MIYKTINKFNKNIFFIFLMLLGLISCYDSGYEEFVPPTGNVNNIQPNTLFTTTTSADDTMSFVFRSYSTDAASYLWDFGDGKTSTEANPDYTYAEGGLYKVKLITTSSDGLKAVDSSNVAPIFVDFNTTQEDTEVTFENLTSGASKLVWDFGDGESVTWNVEDTQDDPNFNPVHVYKTAETFKATLVATTYLGVPVSITKNIEGLILSTIPDFTYAVSGYTVQFTDASLYAESYSWDFGDGGTSTEASPSHLFPGEGTYEVTLTTTNEAGVSKSNTQMIPIGAIEATFPVIVLNGTTDDGDVSDWNMVGTWDNSALDAWLEANTGDKNQQPGSTSDGSYVDGVKTKGLKLYSPGRRIYQPITVEVGVEYTFTIDSRSEAEGVPTEVYILNTAISSEDNILDYADAFFEITNDFNSSKGSATENTFTTNTFTFVPTSTTVIIYIRALNAVDSSNEVFIDNIGISTPGFDDSGNPIGGGVDPTFKANVLNGTTDDGDISNWNMVGTWSNSALDAWLEANTGDKNQQPGSTSDGAYVDGVKTKGLKLSSPGRRLYQPVTVEVGVEYTFTIDSRSEAEGIPTEVYILNTEITSEDNILDNADAFFEITNDFNSSKGSATENTFTTTTFKFKPTTTTALIYVRALKAVDSSNEVFIDNIDIITPGF